MSLLQLIIIITSTIFLFLSYDAYKRKKINLIHIVILFVGLGMVGTAVFIPGYQGALATIFGTASGADAIVYISIISLVFLYFELLNSYTKQKLAHSKLITNLALESITLPKHTVRVGVLMRAYNEATTLASVIDEVIGAGYLVIICDDGSHDQTQHIISHKIVQYPHNLISLRHIINCGGGCANKTLFEFVRRYGDSLNISQRCMFDSDGQMDVADIGYFSQHMGHHDVIFGSRFLDGSVTTNIPLARKILLYGGKILLRIVYGVDVADPHNGMRMLSTHAIRKIQLTSDTFGYANDLVQEVADHNLVYIQLPTHITYTDHSLAKGQKNSNAIAMLVEILYKKFFFR